MNDGLSFQSTSRPVTSCIKMAPYLDDMEKYFKSNGRVKESPAHSAKVHSVGWSCDGRRLASGSFDKTVCIFTLDRDRMVKSLEYRLSVFTYYRSSACRGPGVRFGDHDQKRRI